MTLHAALSMGGYGGYVWTSYGISLLGLVSLAAAARRSWRSEIKRARRRIQSKAAEDSSTASDERPGPDKVLSPR